jgi:hypothetical protein
MGFLDPEGREKVPVSELRRGRREESERLDSIVSEPLLSLFRPQSRNGAPSANWGQAATTGSFTPARPITIRYRNFQNQDKTFTADAEVTVRKKNHLVAAVAPSGKKIVLARNRIQNLSEVESALPQKIEAGQGWPSPGEAQVLGYHKKHGTSSPLYEKVRGKYPNW